MTTQPAAAVIPIEHGELAGMLFAATQEVFTSMLGTDVEQFPEPEADRSEPFDGVLSLIGIAGGVIGNGALICTSDTARKLSSRLLMMEFETVDEQVLDAVGEITNMIVGGFKNLLEPHTGRLQMSIPSVIFGKNICARNAGADLAVAVRCGFPEGELEVKIRLAAARE
jgi:chemotaxis protein CheX